MILTTHYMDEAEALADRVAVINAGRIIAERHARVARWTYVGEATIRFRLPAETAVTDLPVPVTASDSGAVEIRTGHEIEVLAGLTTGHCVRRSTSSGSPWSGSRSRTSI